MFYFLFIFALKIELQSRVHTPSLIRFTLVCVCMFENITKREHRLCVCANINVVHTITIKAIISARIWMIKPISLSA